MATPAAHAWEYEGSKFPTVFPSVVLAAGEPTSVAVSPIESVGEAAILNELPLLVLDTVMDRGRLRYTVLALHDSAQLRTTQLSVADG